MQGEDRLDEHAQLERGLRAAFGAGEDLRAGPALPPPALTVMGTLRRWLHDPDLAPVRDIEDLPDDWSALWAAAGALLRQHPPAARRS